MQYSKAYAMSREDTPHPPCNHLSPQTQALIDLKAELGDRFLLTDMILLDRFPLPAQVLKAIETRRLTPEQCEAIVETAREGIQQLGTVSRRSLTTLPAKWARHRC